MESVRFGSDIRPLSEFGANVAAFVQQVRSTRRPLILTQHGKPAAVLLDVDEYERLVERAELMDDIATAEQQIDRGEGVEHETARADVLRRLGR